MRLTLRTLLAYLDDVLEPNESREIGKKIAQSKEAAALVDQIRESIRRRRIAAPELAGPGSGPDPNIVSEYLENVLPPDQVVEYEKLCRQSDLHLAEVAACHKILTMVMGQPIQVSDDLRERMYALGATREVAPLISSVAVAVNAPKMTTGMGEVNPVDFQEGLPDYLKGRKSSGRLWTTLLVLIMAGVWVSLIAFDKSIWTSDTQAKVADVADVQVDQSSDLASDLDDDKLEAGAVAVAQAGTDQPTTKVSTPEKPAPAPLSNKAVSTKPQSSVSVNPLPPSEEEVAAAIPKPPKMKTPVVATPPEPGDVAVPTQTASVAPQPEKLAGELAKVDPAKMNVPEKGTTQNVPPSQVKEEPLFVVKPDGINIFLGRMESDWVTIEDGTIDSGDQFAVPEPFSGLLNFADDLSLFLLPDARIERFSAAQGAALGLQVQRGRILIKRPTTSLHPSSVDLRIGQRTWRVTFAEAGTEMAIEVILPQPAGKPAAGEVLLPVAGIGVTSGTAQLEPLTAMPSTARPEESEKSDAGGRKSIELLPTHGWIELQLDRETMVTDRALPLPEWVNFQDVEMTPARRQLAKAYEREFKQNVFQSIGPVIADRRATISEFATKTMSLIDHPLEIIPALRSDHEETRIAAIRSLREWLAADPQHVEPLREEMERRIRPEVIEVIVELLWGFGLEDSQSEEKMKMLVELLGHEELAVRELAHFQLTELSGRNYGYHAQAPIPERKAAINRWADYVDRMIKSE